MASTMAVMKSVKDPLILVANLSCHCVGNAGISHPELKKVDQLTEPHSFQVDFVRRRYSHGIEESLFHLRGTRLYAAGGIDKQDILAGHQPVFFQIIQCRVLVQPSSTYPNLFTL